MANCMEKERMEETMEKQVEGYAPSPPKPPAMPMDHWLCEGAKRLMRGPRTLIPVPVHTPRGPEIMWVPYGLLPQGYVGLQGLQGLQEVQGPMETSGQPMPIEIHRPVALRPEELMRSPVSDGFGSLDSAFSRPSVVQKLQGAESSFQAFPEIQGSQETVLQRSQGLPEHRGLQGSGPQVPLELQGSQESVLQVPQKPQKLRKQRKPRGSGSQVMLQRPLGLPELQEPLGSVLQGPPKQRKQRKPRGKRSQPMLQRPLGFPELLGLQGPGSQVFPEIQGSQETMLQTPQRLPDLQGLQGSGSQAPLDLQGRPETVLQSHQGHPGPEFQASSKLQGPPGSVPQPLQALKSLVAQPVNPAPPVELIPPKRKRRDHDPIEFDQTQILLHNQMVQRAHVKALEQRNPAILAQLTKPQPSVNDLESPRSWKSGFQPYKRPHIQGPFIPCSPARAPKSTTTQSTQTHDEPNCTGSSHIPLPPFALPGGTQANPEVPIYQYGIGPVPKVPTTHVGHQKSPKITSDLENSEQTRKRKFINTEELQEASKRLAEDEQLREELKETRKQALEAEEHARKLQQELDKKIGIEQGFAVLQEACLRQLTERKESEDFKNKCEKEAHDAKLSTKAALEDLGKYEKRCELLKEQVDLKYIELAEVEMQLEKKKEKLSVDVSSCSASSLSSPPCLEGSNDQQHVVEAVEGSDPIFESLEHPEQVEMNEEEPLEVMKLDDDSIQVQASEDMITVPEESNPVPEGSLPIVQNWADVQMQEMTEKEELLVDVSSSSSSSLSSPPCLKGSDDQQPAVEGSESASEWSEPGSEPVLNGSESLVENSEVPCSLEASSPSAPPCLQGSGDLDPSLEGSDADGSKPSPPLSVSSMEIPEQSEQVEIDGEETGIVEIDDGTLVSEGSEQIVGSSEAPLSLEASPTSASSSSTPPCFQDAEDLDPALEGSDSTMQSLEQIVKSSVLLSPVSESSMENAELSEQVESDEEEKPEIMEVDNENYANIQILESEDIDPTPEGSDSSPSLPMISMESAKLSEQVEDVEEVKPKTMAPSEDHDDIQFLAVIRPPPPRPRSPSQERRKALILTNDQAKELYNLGLTDYLFQVDNDTVPQMVEKIPSNPEILHYKLQAQRNRKGRSVRNYTELRKGEMIELREKFRAEQNFQLQKGFIVLKKSIGKNDNYHKI